MSVRSKVMKLLGEETIDGSSILNLAIKRLLKCLKIPPGAQVFELLRTVYRFNSRVVVIEKSHSTFGEDRILNCYLPEITGSYVDVGSGSPINGSNTYLFYKRGWSGITIDPLATVGKLHRKKRPRDRQVVACISDSTQAQVKFYQYTADDFSTDSEERMEFLATLKIEPVLSTPVKTLKLSNLVGPTGPLSPSLLDIDVEGNELSVLESNNWEVYLPRVICIEEWKSPLYETTDVRLFLEAKGYKMVSRAFVSSIYVHSKYLADRSATRELKAQWFLP